jgi:restriction endonuclease Mrr
LRETVQASDVVLLLLSPAAAGGRWIDALALSDDLDRRGVDLIPILGVSADLPPTMRDRAVVDLTRDFTAGLQQLAAQIEATAQANFSSMSPRAFEDLVADLLRAVGFGLDARHRTDPGKDLRATYQRVDPFGRPETEVWLVQAKLYAHERVSVDAIRQLAGALAVASGPTRGLLVTNAQLTSVARDYVAKLERSPNVRLRLIDGVELRRLLRQFPAIAARHFGETATSDPRRDGDS